MKTLKIEIFILIFLVNGLSFSQEIKSLDAAISTQEISIIQSSVSNSGNFYAALFSDSKTLLVAKNEFGDIPVSKKIEFENGEGGFRPEGYASDQYIYYVLFDVSSIIPSKVRIHPKPSSPKKIRKSHANLKLSGFMHGDSYISKNSINAYQTQLTLANANNFYVDRTQVNPTKYEFRFTNQPAFIFAQDDQFVCFSEGAEKVSLLNISGDLISSKEIITNKPFISSSKGKTILMDKSTGIFYMVVETNFSYNFYQVDVNSGKTKYLFKTETVWPNPNWQLNNGVLNYEKTLENKKVRLSQYINE